MPSQKFQTFEEFWPFYLTQHQNSRCRNLHFFGTTLALLFFVLTFISGHYALLILSPVIAYFFAWIGHFGFEKNRPATFTYPRWSFYGDLKMLKLFYSGELKLELNRYGLK